MYQKKAEYNSENAQADEFLSFNSDKFEHQVQLTTTLSSIQPFLKKKFLQLFTLTVVQKLACVGKKDRLI